MAQITAPPMQAGETYVKFPYSNAEQRIRDYNYYEDLFLGNHYKAFNIKVDDPNFTKLYSMLRYVKVNFAGLVSKVVADLLFSEPIIIKAEGGDQEFLEGLIFENNLDAQFYESALSNSYFGDDLFKLRIGKRNSSDTKPSVIIEENTPKVYFPEINRDNIRAVPDKQELAWLITVNGDEYLRKEIHMAGKILNEVYTMRSDGTIGGRADNILTQLGLKPEEETKIDRPLVTHVPNWKTSGRFFGLSDYIDLDSLFFAINNRFTKIDNVLDLHTDPILAVPEGVLDEEGKVRRDALNMIEVSEASGKEKPEYIVWNASLENAFSQIDHLVEVFFMVSETSPDILGMGKGTSDSGRALKLKILRTIAKASRKRLYYDRAIKEVLYNAQLLAKAWGIEVNGKRLQGEPVIPQIEWNDGLPIDDSEAIDDEVKRIDAGITTVKDSLMRLDGLDEKEAETKAKEIKDANKIDLPKMNLGNNPFNQNQNNNQNNNNNDNQNNK